MSMNSPAIFSIISAPWGGAGVAASILVSIPRDHVARSSQSGCSTATPMRFMGSPHTPDSAPSTLSPGTRFGAYEILEQLGAGGMGEPNIGEEFLTNGRRRSKI